MLKASHGILRLRVVALFLFIAIYHPWDGYAMPRPPTRDFMYSKFIKWLFLLEADQIDAADYKHYKVEIPVPFMEAIVPLEEWIRIGPGPRTARAPCRMWDIRTGEKVDTALIPLRYRNDRKARFMYRIGRLENPWKWIDLISRHDRLKTETALMELANYVEPDGERSTRESRMDPIWNAFNAQDYIQMICLLRTAIDQFDEVDQKIAAKMIWLETEFTKELQAAGLLA